MGRESWRKLVHISMAGWALLIGRVPPLFIVLLALAALLFNIFVLPRLTGRNMEREADRKLGFSLGMIAYPAMVLLLSLLFFRQQVYLAIGWGAMAFGDGFATVAGSKWGTRTIANTRKTWTGTCAFLVAGGIFTILLVWLLPVSVRQDVPGGWWIAAIMAAITLSAMTEVLNGLIDDNIVVPVTASAVSFLVISIYTGGYCSVPDHLVAGLAFIAVMVAVSLASGKFSAGGVLAGAVVAALIFTGAGIAGLVLLLVFVLFGVLGSAWKYGEKVRLGLAQENQGKRTLTHVLANGATAGLCGLLGWLFPQHDALFTGMVAASLASALADTLSSELGNLYGRRYINIITWKPDRRGLDGVVSLQGTLAGVAGSTLIALTYGVLHDSYLPAVVVLVSGVTGTIIDSCLGATLQRGGYLNNHTVNLINTFCAALCYYGLMVLFTG